MNREARVSRRAFLQKSLAVGSALAGLATFPDLTPPSVQAAPLFENRVGWAYSPYPHYPLSRMVRDFRQMQDLGMNIVYMGHINNPANLAAGLPTEPGMGFPVYDELRQRGPGLRVAEQLWRGVLNFLEASSKVGLPVVFPIDYQIQMGKLWNDRNFNHLRVDPNKPETSFRMEHWGSGFTASPYSPQLRSDKTAYYQWLSETILRHFPNISALNLGDEPMGGDYSDWAKSTFEEKYGIPFDQAEPQHRGKFQAGVLADYAEWAASFWMKLWPDLKTMMTFHIQRETPLFPSFERVYQLTPPNFVFSFDSHYHDRPAEAANPINDQDRQLLTQMVRQHGWYSQTYHRPLMLWTSANGWGLGHSYEVLGGGLDHARENLRIVGDLTKVSGGRIAMIMAWGWNINNQGAYEYAGQRSYQPEQMIETVSAGLRARRDHLSDQLPSQPNTVIHIPANRIYQEVGLNYLPHLAPPLSQINDFRYTDQNVVYLTDGPALDQARLAGIPIITLA